MLMSPSEYVASAELKEAIKVAEVTGRPLLIKGEPGTGKTLLAQYIADQKGCEIFHWHVKSTSLAKDGLYFYDAVTRLNDSRFPSEDTDVKNIENYIRLEAMGQAFAYQDESVLLIDEIDKADIEFPNDLLLELDKMQFTIQETGRVIKAEKRPFVVITSNDEKELPDAFLRRCIFHFIEFPKPELMTDIVKAHFPDIQHSFLQQALESFYQLREDKDLKKKPSTSELIDWINILLHQGAAPETQGKRTFLGTLLKSEDDYFRFK